MGLEEFCSALSDFYAHTQIKKVQTKDIFFAYLDKTAPGQMSGYMYTGGLNAPKIPFAVNEKLLKKWGATDDVIRELHEEPDLIFIKGEPYLITHNAMYDMVRMTKLGAVFSKCSPERTVSLSKYMPGDKEVSLVVRESGRLKMITAVRGDDFEYNPADVIAEICRAVPAVFGIEDCEMEWSIDHSVFSAKILMDKFELSNRKSFGLEDALPYIEIIDSATGESSFIIKGGIEVEETNVVMYQDSWEHRANNRDSLSKEVKKAAEEMKGVLSNFLFSLNYISCDFTDHVDKLDQVLDFVYNECAVTKLGKKVWAQAKEQTIADLAPRSHFTGKDIAIELFRNCPTLYPEVSKMLASVPAAIEKWMSEEPSFYGQISFGT